MLLTWVPDMRSWNPVPWEGLLGFHYPASTPFLKLGKLRPKET